MSLAVNQAIVVSRRDTVCVKGVAGDKEREERPGVGWLLSVDEGGGVEQI